jgi:hypothetical protein
MPPSSRLLVDLRNAFQTLIPIRATCDKNMGVGSDFDRAIETPGRYDQQGAIHLNTGNRGTAFCAKASLMPRRWKTKRFDFGLTRQPIDLGG